MQLDFDLQRGPEIPEPRVLSVSELTRRVRSLIEDGIGEAWVEGEISNHRKQASGHQYFTLKDDACQLACVLFSGTAAGLRGLKLADGQKVQVFGALSVYEPRGQYQMIVRLVQNRGEGALQARFEALKRKLAAEGLFDAGKKRPLPGFPRRVGLVTSPTGAAIRDFLHVLHRRHPGIEVLINPVRVQGRGASAEIARAIGEFGSMEKFGLPAVDVIVVTRGGGSIEDLWEFNEEIVARAISASPIPVLSAIGHEIDFTIADFAADVRAPTPSAAAEILAADRIEVLARLRQDSSRLVQSVRSRLDVLAAQLGGIRQSPLFREPSRKLQELRLTLDRQAETLHQNARLACERIGSLLERKAALLAAHAPGRRIEEARLENRALLQKITATTTLALTTRKARLERIAGILSALNPQATLARGYTITTDAQGRPLSSANEARPGMVLRTRFHDGETQSIMEPPHPVENS